ncbi:MAG: NAD(P)-dependent oxidoreductase [Lachnospiraceae bacterium]|nr:NAD(P)-dependent oxidoreductase [Lachnospiraceae bacterium]
MKKAIVTGANGFVGTAVCRELANQGVEVIAIIRHPDEIITGIADIKGLRIVYCDLAEFGKLADLISDRDVDAFYHFAWVGSAGPLRGNSDVQLKNVQYTCDSVKVCAAMNCKRFVFASSVMEYEIEATMATEATPGINTLYCSAKVAADYMARTIAGSFGVEYIRAVISNIYGPGEMSPRLVNTSIRKMLKGEHCAFSAGEQMYDFIYITDAAKTFAAIGEKGKNNKTYYIGSLNPRPLKHFLTEMRDSVDPAIEIGLGELPFNGVSLTYKEFDITAVKEDTGFAPEVSFKEGIQNTAEWIRTMRLQ